MDKTIVVLAEHIKGKLCDITFEMLGKAKDISKSTNSKLVVLLFGSNVENLAQQLGQANEVIYVNNERLVEFVPEIYVHLLANQINELKPWLIFVGATSIGLDVASIISAKLNIPLVSSCRDIKFDGDVLVSVSQLYGGKMLVENELKGAQIIISILPGAFNAEKGKSQDVPNVKKVEVSIPDDSKMSFERLVEPDSSDVDITKSPVLVSVGRGIQSQDNIPLAQELADLLGGAVSASRPVVDQGWLPTTRQVGRSGMTVRPKLYLALGISGAPEHVEGMKDSELIVAVNTDKNAPIFDIAHYGIIADVLEFVPILKDEIAKKKE